MQYPVCFGAEAEIKAMVDRGLTGATPSNIMVPRIVKETPHGTVITDPDSLLLEERILQLYGPFEDGMAHILTSLMLILSSKSAQDMTMYINSGGGSVISGYKIIDTIESIPNDVAIIVNGMAASMGAATLINGAKGKRFATPRSQIMVHQVSAGTQGTIKDMERSFDHSKRLNDELHAMFVEKTGQPESVVDTWFDRDTWMSAEEAKDNGIIDDVVKPANPVAQKS
ncbi:MAG: ATP-dependent Clp protease proteolytic subunit [Alphaproteobacteria bacterium]|nr:ATP-dependent Clp protease proteolytic subunit [Alphaproteobacteria bacterium]